MKRMLRFVLVLWILKPALGQSAGAPQSASSSCADGDQAVAVGQWEAARRLYLNCLASSPQRFDVLSNLGVVYTRMGQMQEAIGSYQRALALSPGNPKVEFNLAVVLVKTGSYGAAAEHLSALRKVEPNEGRVGELLAFCYYHLGRYTLAAREAEQVYKSHPDDAGNALILGSAYTRLGHYEKALPLITLALKAAGSADGHLIMGETLLGLRLYQPALDELTKASLLQPNLPGLHSALGMAQAGLGKSKEATAEFKLALAADPNDYQANYYMGRFERLDDDIPAAKEFLGKAEQLSPGTPEVRFELAVIEMEEHHYAKAETLLTEVLRREPDHRQAHFLLAEVYLKQGRREEAQRERKISEKLQKEQESKTANDNRTVEKSADSSSHNEP